MNLEDTQQVAEGSAEIPHDAPNAADARHNDRQPAERREDTREPKSLKDQIRDSVAEHKPALDRARAPDGKFAPNTSKPDGESEAPVGAAAPATASSPDSGDKPSEAPAAQEPDKAQVAPAPEALSKDMRAKWHELPEDVRNEFIRRETDSSKGVQQLQERYRSIDDSLKPYRPLLQQRGVSEGDAINQLFGWHQALSGPHKAEAAKALLKSHGIDPSTLAAGSPAAQHEGESPQTQTLPPEFQQIAQQVGTLEQQFQREQNERAARKIAEFAKDKPHFEAVKLRMGQLIQAGAATDIEDAYNQAIWSDPNVRAAMQQETEDKRKAEAEAAAEKKRTDAAKAEEERKRKEAEEAAKARKAGVSPRGSTPHGDGSAHRPKGKSVGESLREARRELSGSV